MQVSVIVLVVAVLESIASENVNVKAVLRSMPVVPDVAIVVDPCTRDDTLGVVEVEAVV